MIKRFVLALAMSLPLLAHGVEAPYVTDKDLDLRHYLPLPIAAGSDADKAQQAEVIAAQKAASPERIALAQADAAESIYDMYGKTFALDKAKLPKISHLFERVGESEDATVDSAKPFYGRIRPFLANSEIKPLVKQSKSGAYPSGHATRVTAVAIILTAMIPEKRDMIWKRVEEYSFSRIIGGMHYREDIEVGLRTGSALATAIMNNADYKADYPAARAELRTSLGLAN